MLKSELSERLSEKFTDLSVHSISDHTTLLIDTLIAALSKKERIEIRGFGSFSLNYHSPRKAHNPKTGQRIVAPGKYRPHFKPGKELRTKINYSSTK